MATHSRILAWRIPWSAQPGELQSMRSRSQTGLSNSHTHMYISVFFILILYSLYFTAGISMVFRSWFRGENQVRGEELSEAASWKWDNEDAVKQPQVSARSLYCHRTNGGLYLLIRAAGQTCNPGM